MSPKHQYETIYSELSRLQKLALDDIGPDPALSSREIVERALILTLSNAEPREKLLAFYFVVRFGSHGESEADLRDRLDSPKLARERKERFAEKWWAETKLKREWFCDQVESIISNAEAARRRLKADIREGWKRVIRIPRVSWNDREFQREIVYVCPDIEAVFIYSLMLMLDASGEVGKALKKCKLSQCGRLFLSFPPVGGGPRPYYCDSEHKLMADRLTGAERTARWREKKRRQSKKKRTRVRK